MTVHIDDGLVRENPLVHFPIPMTNVWDNVIYSDSTVLFFDSDAQIDDWTRRRNIARGDTQPVQRVWGRATIPWEFGDAL